jgi:hypothetical protein
MALTNAEKQVATVNAIHREKARVGLILSAGTRAKRSASHATSVIQ